MRNKLLSLLLCLTVLCFTAAPAAAAEHAYTVAEVERLCDGIVGFKAGSSAQRFINGALCDTAGESAEFYIIALSQQGDYDFSAYENALLRFLDQNEVYSATSREKYALALIAAGSNNGYISEVADEAIGGQGLMSLVFGLHILNNGYQSRLYTVEGLINTILGYQLSDGGWAVIGNRGDVDVTAMTLQALAPYCYTYSDVKAAVGRGLGLLSDLQQTDGGYYGMGVENCESAAQALTALCCLGIDPNTDSRFIKNGSSVLDAMMRYRNADGSFSHTGGGFNETATVQAFYAMTAYLRYCRGQSPLYVLDHRSPATVEPARTEEEHPQQTQRAVDPPKEQRNSDDQSNRDSSDHGNQRTQEPTPQIIYIDGVPYSVSTDSSGRTETTALEPTDAASEPSISPTESRAGQGAGLFQPTESSTDAATVDEARPARNGSYKPYAIGGVLAAAVITAIVLYLLKKRNKKHYIAIGILAAAAILLILLTDFESRESYQAVKEKTDTVGSVTLSIRCDTLKKDKKSEYIPEDCVILKATSFDIDADDTVYDVLLEASKRYGIQLDNRGSAGNAYIAGIQYLYEFDYGELSGWMYQVNGAFPDVGCQSCHLKDGDKIEWLYTKNIGKDL